MTSRQRDSNVRVLTPESSACRLEKLGTVPVCTPAGSMENNKMADFRSLVEFPRAATLDYYTILAPTATLLNIPGVSIYHESRPRLALIAAI